MLAGVCLVAAGCASFPAAGWNNSDRMTSAQEASQGAYRVEFTNLFGRASYYDGQIDGPITVQTALERSGATKKYRNMEVAVLRVTEDTQRPLRMVVDYLPGKKMVRPEQDYAILNGDRITVSPSSNNLLDKLNQGGPTGM